MRLPTFPPISQIQVTVPIGKAVQTIKATIRKFQQYDFMEVSERI
jgi:hypothetical protein